MANYMFLAPRTLEPTVAVIKCATPDYRGSNANVVAAIKIAVGNWLAYDSEGRQAWEDTDQDFNWGDLAHYCQLVTLTHHLRAKGIFHFTVEEIIGAGDLALTFDDMFHPSKS